MNSDRFLIEEASPSQKFSLVFEHNLFVPESHIRKLQCELALPITKTSPLFAKIELKQQNLFRIVPSRINLVTDYSLGLMKGSKTY
jgi:hypothetical protein